MSMLSKVLLGLVGRRRKSVTAEPLEAVLHRAYLAMSAGEIRKAIEGFREVLVLDPYHVQALNDLGVCLADIGDMPEAAKLFELAYSLDDTYIAAVVNHAKLLNDRRKSDEALEHLRLARLNDPDFVAVDTVYSAISLHRGEVEKARHFQLKSWLASFDNLRLANGFLFDTAYADVPERTLASEHGFWAQTVKPLPEAKPHDAASDSALPASRTGRIRIGYWSPDFRNHSVRYFFRPLLENHDRSKYEIFLYHDFHEKDAQTKLMEAACDHFVSVFDLKDVEFEKLVRSHELDVLVELCGHSSHNRVNLLQHRLASVQLTGLGYPPTTGLSSLDGKLLDPHLCPVEGGEFYSEPAIVLPHSFWCFDPLESVPDGGDPPVLKNGFITFGCIGNTAKINARILRCWRDILRRIPRSRLIVRSISFQDPAAQRIFVDQMEQAGMPVDRVDLRLPAVGDDFYRAYQEVDIALDTFPFNGGTTSCFSVFMGVPVVSLAGESLPSRMGLSIMANVGAAHLAVKDEEAYIRQAVRLSQDVTFLKDFRAHARIRMQQSSLGNGAKFAREFESVLEPLLAQKTPAERPGTRIAPLSADELVRRAYTALRRGQVEAAGRIVQHCLDHYPDCGGAHILHTQAMTSAGQYFEAAQYLLEKLPRFSEAEKSAALINVLRCQLLRGSDDEARAALVHLRSLHIEDSFDARQIALYAAALDSEKSGAVRRPLYPLSSAAARIAILVPCDGLGEFEEFKAEFSSGCDVKKHDGLVIERCNENQKALAYKRMLTSGKFDVIIIVQRNIRIFNPDFVSELLHALQSQDVVGFVGALRWQRLHWITDEFAWKAGGFIRPAEDISGKAELMTLGHGGRILVDQVKVLDGGVMAIKCGPAVRLDFDDRLAGAATLMEQDWSYRVAGQGARVAVHQNLGVMVRDEILLDNSNRLDARSHIADREKFDLFSMETDDRSFVSMPLASPEDSVRILNNFFVEP